MADRWCVWQSEFEGLTPFAEEWKEGRVEDFIRNLLNSAAKKRQQRDALLALLAELHDLHATNKQLLAFFELEHAQSWSAENCGASDVDRVMAALTEWRAQILKHSASFPPSEAKTRTMAAIQTCVEDAQAAAATIRPCFGVLDAALSSRASGHESAYVVRSSAGMTLAEPESVDAVAAESTTEHESRTPSEPPAGEVVAKLAICATAGQSGEPG